ncbi:hypothetical protein ARMA_2538 [Ardenticatena maritima]|uniref:Uncharacterized protein n=1 Tax=Ardenticatena maritima TaxID=872965 RepID=A0A0M8K8U4_9CHLR|nr:nitrate reductase cytochrome c-type subunit [Ardenticatena maritima]GAP64115.1 hypothetical protein ARMA_2538 [Ardenticatena maritima]
MSEPKANQQPWLRTGYRLIFIGLAVVLMAATAYVLGTSWLAGQVSAELDVNEAAEAQPARPEPQHVEAGSLFYLDEMQAYTTQDPVMGKVRTLDTYYARRAYDGAPPWVPHPVEDAMAYGSNTCLQCHETGGYVPPMEAYAPVAPHPELLNCTQCHVPVLEETLFRENTYEPAPPPALGNEAYDGAPPPVPHEIVPAMRENCAACHIGPSAPPEIRTDHLERDNCLQCHVPLRTDDEWMREEVRP